ncbi:MAG: hypothetical protein MUF30_01185 [Burkholderiales bacterium]|jgi:hypothetical protein|nr:hypothetical protein [Burkholderiales bacterium]
MNFRIALAATAAALAFTTSAGASTWQLLATPSSGDTLTFVDDAAAPAGTARADRWVLRSYDAPQSFGGHYPHRSARLHYEIDCRAQTVALTDWTFHEGSLGDGRVVWADTMGDAVFVKPVARSAEARLVAATCAR